MLGAIAEARGDWQLAAHHYTKVTIAAPDDADGMLNYGHLLFYHFPEKRTEALCAIIAALQLNPAMPSAYDMLGQNFIREGKISAALTMFETALKYDPDNKLYQDKVLNHL
jgi:tetratricopeptide (TPR) repeat protein